MRVYLMEAGFLARLRSDRKELLAIARTLGTAEEMKRAREDLMSATRVNLAPEPGKDPGRLYRIDAEGVAHIPMVGELTPAAKTDACGAYTAEALTEYGFLDAAIRMADADPDVTAIALDANTPGGYVDGVDLIAQTFAAAKKPTMALVADSMQSAGYYIGSQADRIIALSPASKVGSIGVVVEERDDTRKLAEEGIDRRIYTATDAPEKRPDTTTEEGQAQIIAYADGLQSVFVDRVASGRHTTVENVRANFGKGGTVFAAVALKRGMIDEIRGVDIQRKTAGVAGVETVAKADGTLKTGGVKNMTLEELKRDHPALYAEATKAEREAGKVEGVTEGVAQERKRVEQLSAFKGINADGDKAADAAIRDGKSYAEVAPLIAAATAKGKGPTADGDNPPDVATAAQAAAGGAGMNAEDRAWYLAHGVKAEDLAKIAADTGKEKK